MFGVIFWLINMYYFLGGKGGTIFLPNVLKMV